MRFLKMVRKQAKINTRELAEVVGKSNAYISILETGKIKTIEFNTAYKLLEYINSKKPFVSDDGLAIYELLTDHFDIYPQDYWNKELEAEQIRQEQQIQQFERIGDKISKISAFVDDEDLADLLLLLAQSKLDDCEIEILNNCFNVSRDETKSKALYDLINILTTTPGWGQTGHYKTNKDKSFYNELEELLTKYKFVEGE